MTGGLLRLSSRQSNLADEFRAQRTVTRLRQAQAEVRVSALRRAQLDRLQSSTVTDARPPPPSAAGPPAARDDGEHGGVPWIHRAREADAEDEAAEEEAEPAARA